MGFLTKIFQYCSSVPGHVRALASPVSLHGANTNLQFQAGKYPWIGAYLNSGQNPGGCAGTLVAAEWVVTAAHCLDGVTKDNLKIILGEYDLSSATDSADTNR